MGVLGAKKNPYARKLDGQEDYIQKRLRSGDSMETVAAKLGVERTTLRRFIAHRDLDVLPQEWTSLATVARFAGVTGGTVRYRLEKLGASVRKVRGNCYLKAKDAESILAFYGDNRVPESELEGWLKVPQVARAFGVDPSLISLWLQRKSWQLEGIAVAYPNHVANQPAACFNPWQVWDAVKRYRATYLRPDRAARRDLWCIRTLALELGVTASTVSRWVALGLRYQQGHQGVRWISRQDVINFLENHPGVRNAKTLIARMAQSGQSTDGPTASEARSSASGGELHPDFLEGGSAQTRAPLPRPGLSGGLTQAA